MRLLHTRGFQDIGGHGAGVNTGNPHRTIGQLNIETFTQASNRKLGGCIRALALHAGKARRTGQVDDVRLVCLLQEGKKIRAAVHDTPVINPCYPGQVSDVLLFKGQIHRHPGVIDQDMHCAMDGNYLPGQFLHLLLIGNIHHVHTRPAAPPLDGRAHRLQAGGIDINQRQVGTLVRKLQTHRSSDTAAGTCYHRDTPAYLFHGYTSNNPCV